jgi:hypothetical protein
LTYDFQTVGEYTLVRSTKDDFSVQVRQAPVPGSRMASINQAMAATIGGQRVTVTMENNRPVLRMDGAASERGSAAAARRLAHLGVHRVR